MTIRFNKLNNKYDNYSFGIGHKAPDEEVKRAKEANETEEVSTNKFIGLKNEEDLLTHNAQNLYGVNIKKYTHVDKDIIDETNKILEQLGCTYKVDAQQVASVANNVNNVVLPGLKKVDNAAVEARIMDPNGPFSDLFC